MIGLGSRVIGWLIVIIVALATSAGMYERLLKPDDTPYLLITREVGDHPVWALLILVVIAGAYAWAFIRLCRVIDRWRDGVGSGQSPPEPTGRWIRIYALVEHLYSAWWRISLALFVVWLPFYATSFPGQPSPDAANMLTEFLLHRSDFAGAPLDAPADGTAPYLDYPTSSYLLTDSDSLWSNHHPLYLMLSYGWVASMSTHLFGSLVPGLMALSAASAIFTLVAFGRGLGILGTLVADRRVRAAALGITAASVLIPLWSMAIHKNQLFCAAFVWWLALLARYVYSAAPVGRRWYLEATAVSLVMAMSVQFGWILLVAQAVVMVFVQGRRVGAALTLALPALAVFGSIGFVTAQGAAIPSDPIETKGLQLQTMALILREHPDALTAEQREQLERIFDIDSMTQNFDPANVDPVKSTYPLEVKTTSFRYQTVQEEDWEPFNAIWLDLARRYPGTFLDGLFLKSYRYLDPLDADTDWYPPWSHNYVRHIGEYQAAPMEFNYWPRKKIRQGFNVCHDYAIPCRVLVDHPPRTVLVVLLFGAAIAVRRRYAWLWAMPFALQIGIAAVSPLSAGGRYVLASTYGLGIALMLLAIRDDRTPSDNPGS